MFFFLASSYLSSRSGVLFPNSSHDSGSKGTHGTISLPLCSRTGLSEKGLSYLLPTSVGLLVGPSAPQTHSPIHTCPPRRADMSCLVHKLKWTARDAGDLPCTRVSQCFPQTRRIRSTRVHKHPRLPCTGSHTPRTCTPYSAHARTHTHTCSTPHPRTELRPLPSPPVHSLPLPMDGHLM